MDRCTHEVRAQYWKRIIDSCHQRPAGQSAKAWMDENGICEQSYYSWQRRLRQEIYHQLPAAQSEVPTVSEHSEITFTEMPFQQERVATANEWSNSHTPAAVLTTATLTIAITNEISDSLLSRIIQEVSHA